MFEIINRLPSNNRTLFGATNNDNNVIYAWTAEKLLKGENMADGSHQLIAGRCQLSG